MLLVWCLQVNVDQAVARGVQVGAEGEHTALVGDVRVLRLKVVHQLHPRQQVYRYRCSQIYWHTSNIQASAIEQNVVEWPYLPCSKLATGEIKFE